MLPNGAEYQTMRTIPAFALCLLVASISSTLAQKYPNTRDEDLPKNTIGGEYSVLERTPVYRSRAAGERAFFYLPRNSRVEIVGKIGGWGVFSNFIPERFNTLLAEAAPDEAAQYGWIRLDKLKRTEALKAQCPNLPPASSADAYFDCAGEYDAVSATAIVVFMQGYKYAGHTYRRADKSLLNTCIRMCRDEAKCVGFAYSASRAQCELKDSGKVDRDHIDFKEPPFPDFAGVKLVGY